MMRRFILVVFGVLLLSYGWLVSDASNKQLEKTQNKCANPPPAELSVPEKHENTPNERACVHEEDFSLTDAVTAVATIVMAVIAGLQLRAYNRVIDREIATDARIKAHEEATQRNARADLRAYIHATVDSIDGLDELNGLMATYALPGGFIPAGGSVNHTENGKSFDVFNPPRTLGYTVSLKNFGKTHAKNVAFNVSAGIDMRVQPVTADIKDLPTIETIDALVDFVGGIDRVLAPGTPFVFRRSIGSELSVDEINGLRSGTMAIFVFGYIRYDDFFGERQLTRFRFAHIVGTDGRFGDYIEAHHQGNRVS